MAKILNGTHIEYNAQITTVSCHPINVYQVLEYFCCIANTHFNKCLTILCLCLQLQGFNVHVICTNCTTTCSTALNKKYFGNIMVKT